MHSVCPKLRRFALQLWAAGIPFVAENVVSAEILEITASKADERQKFLLG